MASACQEKVKRKSREEKERTNREKGKRREDEEKRRRKEEYINEDCWDVKSGRWGLQLTTGERCI